MRLHGKREKDENIDRKKKVKRGKEESWLQVSLRSSESHSRAYGDLPVTYASYMKEQKACPKSPGSVAETRKSHRAGLEAEQTDGRMRPCPLLSGKARHQQSHPWSREITAQARRGRSPCNPPPGGSKGRSAPLPAKSQSSMWHFPILSTSSGILMLYFSTTAILASSSLSSAAVTYLLKPPKPSLCTHLLINLSLIARFPEEDTRRLPWATWHWQRWQWLRGPNQLHNRWEMQVLVPTASLGRCVTLGKPVRGLVSKVTIKSPMLELLPSVTGIRNSAVMKRKVL